MKKSMDFSSNALVNYGQLEPDENRVSSSANYQPVGWAERAVYSLLKNIDTGSLAVTDYRGVRRVFGQGKGSLCIECVINNPKFFSKILCEGSLGLGDAFVDGWWDVNETQVADLFRIIFSAKLEYMIKGSPLARLSRCLHQFLSNPRRLGIAKRNIEIHYDIGNAFYRHMLDDTMTYSCGYRIREGDSLQQMQEQKFERIYNKLGLERGGSIIDIGCGWGGMLIYSAKRNPALQGVGITLSEEQYQLANERIASEGLSHRVKVHLQDYRQIQGNYDFLVSVGMFEHVGKESYDLFFRKAKELLNDNGVGLLHTIGLEEALITVPDPWIAKYIFPGSYLPRLEEIARGLRRVGCTVGHIENLQPHYALTLKKWSQNFRAHWKEIRKLGPQFNDRFYRMWNYYLQVSEACFSDSTMNVYQVLFSKGTKWNFPYCFNF